MTEGSDVDAVIDAKGLKQMERQRRAEKIIDEVIAANPAGMEARQGQGLQMRCGPGTKASKRSQSQSGINDCWCQIQFKTAKKRPPAKR